MRKAQVVHRFGIYVMTVGLALAGAQGVSVAAEPAENQAPLRIIVFGAHPDDCELKAGGVAARWAAQGHKVKFVSVTNGDIGHFDEDGYLVITDRIKDLIITSGGKNVAPQRIESIVGKDYYIDQLAVVGDQRSAVGAIVVPAFEALAEFARERKLPFRDNDELISLPEVVELYRERIRNQSRELAPFEKIRRFTLVARQFTQQAGEITPTLKIRRKVVAEKYRELIERMYGGNETPEQDTSA